MKETCPRCGYIWDYNGKLPLRRTCPNCGYNWIKKKNEPTYRVIKKDRITILTRRKKREEMKDETSL